MDFYFLNHVTKSENIVCPTPVCHYLLCIYLGHYILCIITYIRATVTVTHKLTQLEFLTKTFFSLCKMTEKIKFLCGNFESDNLIYGISFGEYDWHYFKIIESSIFNLNVWDNILATMSIHIMYAVRSMKFIIQEVPLKITV